MFNGQPRNGIPPARDVAQARGHLDDTEDWYRQPLTIKEELGTVAAWSSPTTSSGLDDAESRCRQTLTIDEQLGYRPGMATTYHQLGVGSRRFGGVEGAEDWYRQTLTVYDQIGSSRWPARTTSSG